MAREDRHDTDADVLILYYGMAEIVAWDTYGTQIPVREGGR